MKIVVTGATGRLGSALVKHLARPDREIVAVGRRARALPRGAELPGVRPLELDLDVEACVETLAGELGSDVALLHLAARVPHAGARDDRAERARLIDTNVLGTQRVLDAARAGARVIVFPSTSEVYARNAAGPAPGTRAVAAADDYVATKLAGEDHLLAFSAERGVRAVVLRLAPFELARPSAGGSGAELDVGFAIRAFELALTGEASGIYDLSRAEQDATLASLERAGAPL